MPEVYTLADLHKELEGTTSDHQKAITEALQDLSARLSYEDQLKREPNDTESLQNILLWISKAILPDSSCVSYDDPLDEKPPAARVEALSLTQQKAFYGLKTLNSLFTISPPPKYINPSIIVSILAFTNPLDSWTTPPILALSTALLSTLQPHHQIPEFISTHLLQNFIRPLFLKSKRLETITPAGRKAMPSSAPAKNFSASNFDHALQPWRYEVIYAITVFEWAVENISSQDLSTTSLPLTLPPLLHLLDTPSTLLRHRALLLLPLFFTKLTPQTLLSTTGLGSVFSDAIYPILLSVPTLTPLQESELLLPAGYTALFTLVDILHPESTPKLPSANTNTNTSTPTTIPSKQNPAKPQEPQKKTEEARTAALTHILRAAILPAHLYTYPSFPSITTLLLTQLTVLIPKLGIHTVKHLPEIIPMVSEILGDPFAMAKPGLVLEGLRVLREVLLVGWVRFAGVGVGGGGNGGIGIVVGGSERWRMDALKAVLEVYTSLSQSESDSAGEGKEEVEAVRKEMHLVGRLLLAAVEAGDVETSDAFKADIRRLIEVDEGIGEVFGVEVMILVHSNDQ